MTNPNKRLLYFTLFQFATTQNREAFSNCLIWVTNLDGAWMKCAFFDMLSSQIAMVFVMRSRYFSWTTQISTPTLYRCQITDSKFQFKCQNWHFYSVGLEPNLLYSERVWFQSFYPERNETKLTYVQVLYVSVAFYWFMEWFHKSKGGPRDDTLLVIWHFQLNKH